MPDFAMNDILLKRLRRQENMAAVNLELTGSYTVPPVEPNSSVYRAANEGDYILQHEYHGPRTWPPNDTTLMTSADWVH